MGGISRRGFLTGTAFVGAGLAAGLAGCSSGGQSGSDGGPSGSAGATQESHDPVSTEQFDIVVVGSGTAGTCATLRAVEAGASVVCLEKNSNLSGSSQYAEGLAGVGSREQAARGISLDPVQVMESVMEYQHYSCSGPVVKAFVHESGATMDWLADNGVAWYDVKALGDSYTTWHIPADPETGEKIVIGPMIASLQERAKGMGAEFRTECPMTALVVEDGAVVGVYADRDGEEILVRADAVILASGGYANNAELFEEFTGVSYDRVYAYGDEGRDGDGIDGARKIGAATHKPGCVMFHSGKLEGTGSFSELPNYIVCKQPTVRVNAGGERYFNEQVSMTDFSACGNVLTTNAQNFAVFDDDFITHIEVEGPWLGLLALDAEAGVPFECREGIEEFEYIFKADTIADLAEKLGVNAGALEATIERYNGFCESGVDEDFGLPAEYLFPVKTAPFYGAKVYPTLFTTVGGLAVNESMQVLDADGYAIDRLYAAGGDAGSLYGASYDVGVCSGSQQGWAATSGRLGVEHALGLEASSSAQSA